MMSSRNKLIAKTVLYWIISLTWGGIMTFIGLFAMLVLLLLGYRPKRHGHGIYFELGHRWGGISFGPVFIVNEGATTNIKNHEYGHGFQNLCWGILFPIVIAIPSLTRYFYRIYRQKKHPKKQLPPYDNIWFEGQASKWGEKHMMTKL